MQESYKGQHDLGEAFNNLAIAIRWPADSDMASASQAGVSSTCEK